VKSVSLTLTDEQLEDLEPLFREAKRVYNSTHKRGALIAQPYEIGTMTVVFLSPSAAEKMQAVIEEDSRESEKE